MKRLLTMALVAALLTAGAALAAGPVSSLNAGRMFIQPNASFAPPTGANAFGFTGGATGAVGSGPTSTNNDDTCDISVHPAATLLLPYFEVDIRQPANNAINTNFTITNVSQFPQVAHITIWTDRSFPVIDFNIYLTGYDVQGINLYDVIARGQIPPTGSGTAATANVNSPVGSRSLTRDGNPNFIASAAFFAACSSLAGAIPGAPPAGSTIATGLLLDVQNALTIGSYSTCPTGFTAAGIVGSNRGALAVARGYVTVDVANTCSQTLPTTATYYGTEILFDNVLIGDYQRINPRAGLVGISGDAGGNPMVHIRAIPEGGAASSTAVVNFPYTFYDRYTPTAAPGRKADRRQPLPGTFAARFIQGGVGNMTTNLNVWREGTTVGDNGVTCAVAVNAAITATEAVRFDEHENNLGLTGTPCPPGAPSPCIPVIASLALPEASSTPSSDSTFPQLTSPAGDVGGWFYFNLHNGSNVYGNARAALAPYSGVSQNWVTVTHAADAAAGRFSVEFDAASLGHGCSPRPAVTSLTSAAPQIGPAGGAINGTNATP